jgi:hypothetical protein
MHDAFGASYAALWLLAAFQGIVIIAMSRTLVDLRALVERVEPGPLKRLRPGMAAPPFETTEARSKRPLGLHTFAGRRGVVLFVSSRCGACERLVASLATLPDGLTTLIVAAHDEGVLSRLPPGVQCAVEGVSEIAERYRVSEYPSAVVVDEDGLVVEIAHPRTGAEVASLLNRRTTDGDHQLRQAESRVPAVMTR